MEQHDQTALMEISQVFVLLSMLTVNAPSEMALFREWYNQHFHSL